MCFASYLSCNVLLLQIRPYVGCLVQYLPLLWKQSEEHNMLRCAILTTLIHLVQVWRIPNVSRYSTVDVTSCTCSTCRQCSCSFSYVKLSGYAIRHSQDFDPQQGFGWLQRASSHVSPRITRKEPINKTIGVIIIKSYLCFKVYNVYFSLWVELPGSAVWQVALFSGSGNKCGFTCLATCCSDWVPKCPLGRPGSGAFLPKRLGYCDRFFYFLPCPHLPEIVTWLDKPIWREMLCLSVLLCYSQIHLLTQIHLFSTMKCQVQCKYSVVFVGQLVWYFLF